QAGLYVAAAQVLGRDFLARGGLDQRRAPQEDRALVAHDDGLVAHGGHVGAPGGAGAHHHGQLGDVHRGHDGLVVEDAPEVVAVGKDLVLVGQVGAARVDQVDAGQVVLLGDFLGAQVVIDRQRVVGADVDRGVDADDHEFGAADPVDAGK